MGLADFALRVTVGGLMAGHGLQKLNGSFGGSGMEATATTMAAIGMHPAKHQARAAALSETIGGALTATGLMSPLGPAMITGTMAVAIEKVHARNGVWVTKGGFEYNLVLIAASLAVAANGPGVFSIDALLGRRRSGTRWALLAAAAGLGAAAGALQLAGRMAPPEEAGMDAAPAATA